MSRYWLDKRSPAGEVRLTIRLLMPGDGDADVDVSLRTNNTNPWTEEAEIVRSVYDGIHAGIAHAGLPIPDEGLKLEITEVRSRPRLATRSRSGQVRRVAEVLRTMAAASAESLWIGLTDPIAPSAS